MNDRDTRLECLRLALQQHASQSDSDAAIKAARKYADFVFGTRDAEVVRVANELAKVVA